jgi:Zn-dependent metalloprotease
MGYLIKKIFLVSTFFFVVIADAQVQKSDLNNSFSSNSIFDFELIDSNKNYKIEKIENSLWVDLSKEFKIHESDFLDTLMKKMFKGNENSFVFDYNEKDNVGIDHKSFIQYYKGIPVFQSELLVHLQDNYVKSANGYIYDINKLDIKPKFNEKAALRKCLETIGAKEYAWQSKDYKKWMKETFDDSTSYFKPTAVMGIYPSVLETDSIVFLLAYEFTITSVIPMETRNIVINAMTGDIVKNNNLEENSGYPGTAVTKYSGLKTINTMLVPSGKYRLKDPDKNIEVYDLLNFDIKKRQKAINIYDNNNYWDEISFFRQINILNLNPNWNDYLFDGPYPRLYITLTDNSNIEYFRSDIFEMNPSMQDFVAKIRLQNPPVTLRLWEKDNFSSDDLMVEIILPQDGTYTTTYNGTTINYSVEKGKDVALDIFWGLEKGYDFYNSVYNFSNWGNIIAYSHADRNYPGANTQSYGNIPIFLWFGDGIPGKNTEFATLDIVGHELTHWFLLNKKKFVKYKGETGALSESYADFFGHCVDYFVNNTSSTWKISNIFLIGNGYSRNMSDPHDGLFAYYNNALIDRRQPDTYEKDSFWVDTKSSDDNGGVHTNSGVLNYFFYLITDGGSGTNEKGNTYSVNGLGISKSQQIAYKALNYLGKYSTYADIPNAFINTAIDLYGIPSNELTQIKNALYAVGLKNSPGQYCQGTQILANNSASFEDGSANSNYSNNCNCNWIIQPNGADSITLTFSSFNLHNTDTVKVFAGPSTTDPLLFSGTGSTLPPVIGSATSAVAVQFITNAITTNDGWEASYTSEVNPFCSGFNVLTAYSGNFSDESGTSNYVNNANCEWLISPPGANSITLSFTSFNTVDSNDVVMVYDSSNTSGTLLGEFYGNALPPNVTSSGGNMYVLFSSNSTNTSSGWQASYTATGTANCMGTTNLTSVADTFFDGSGTTANYQDRLDCYWLIQPSGATSITLVFDSFDLEPSSQGGVIYDYLEVFDGPDDSYFSMGKFTGVNIPPSLTSTGGSMYLHFHTDGRTTGKGWQAHYSSSNNTTCSGTQIFTSLTDTITDGSDTFNYAPGSDCYFLINPSNAVSIELYFLEFSTQDSADVVTIYDGGSTSDPILGEFSGDSLPSFLYASGGEMLIHFYSNDTIEKQGFEFYYIANTSTSDNAITGYEYWFDDDSLNHISVNTIPKETFLFNKLINTDSLQPGLHAFHIRFKDKYSIFHDVRWSSVLTKWFYKMPESVLDNKIISYEYWFNDDYQNANHNNLNSATNKLVIDTNFLTQNVQVGLNAFHIKFLDTNGLWSSVLTKWFYKMPESVTDNKIVEYEYWFNDDNLTSVSNLISPTKIIVLDTAFDANLLDIGLNTFHIKFKDTNGLWSAVITKLFIKEVNRFGIPTVITGLTPYKSDNLILFINNTHFSS